MKTSISSLAMVVLSAFTVGVADAAPIVRVFNGTIECDIINVTGCFSLFVDGNPKGVTYGTFTAAAALGGSIMTSEVSDFGLPVSLDVSASAVGINPGDMMVMTPFGPISATLAGLTVNYVSPGQMALNELGEFDPQDFLLTVAGGTMTYDLPAGNGSGMHDFGMNPITLRVPAGENFGTWNPTEQRISLQSNAYSESFPIGNTSAMLQMNFLLAQVVPAPGSALILLASFGFARRRR
jgi:hypothetical protein